MTRLVSASRNIPVGVMRIFHPTRLLCVRAGRGEPDESGWLPIIGVCTYFTRCKICAQWKSRLFFEPYTVQIIIGTLFSQQFVVVALLNDAPILDHHDVIGIDYRGKAVGNHE